MFDAKRMQLGDGLLDAGLERILDAKHSHDLAVYGKSIAICPIRPYTRTFVTPLISVLNFMRASRSPSGTGPAS